MAVLAAVLKDTIRRMQSAASPVGMGRRRTLLGRRARHVAMAWRGMEAYAHSVQLGVRLPQIVRYVPRVRRMKQVAVDRVMRVQRVNNRTLTIRLVLVVHQGLRVSVGRAPSATMAASPVVVQSHVLCARTAVPGQPASAHSVAPDKKPTPTARRARAVARAQQGSVACAVHAPTDQSQGQIARHAKSVRQAMSGAVERVTSRATWGHSRTQDAPCARLVQ
jgi:hypothetical protein